MGSTRSVVDFLPGASASIAGETVLGIALQRLSRRKYVNPLKIHPFCTFLLDIIQFKDDQTLIIIRDQKTSRWTGTVQVVLPKDLEYLFKAWLLTYRARMVTEGDPLHDFVFLYPFSRLPIGGKGFSKMFQKAASKHLGLKLNLQIMRRIFIKGVA